MIRHKHLNSIHGRKQGDGKGSGRYIDPSKWITGPDLYTRQKYYAWLKHRSQAQYRHEEYDLTWEDWQVLWPDNLWDQRGRSIESLCLTRLDYEGAWSMDNIIICSRKKHFQLKKEYNRRDGS
tara:strand:- start:503 stop:871 length:369 start_codon:yes stop_codon:yes gene_type:complete